MCRSRRHADPHRHRGPSRTSLAAWLLAGLPALLRAQRPRRPPGGRGERRDAVPGRPGEAVRQPARRLGLRDVHPRSPHRGRPRRARWLGRRGPYVVRDGLYARVDRRGLRAGVTAPGAACPGGGTPRGRGTARPRAAVTHALDVQDADFVPRPDETRRSCADTVGCTSSGCGGRPRSGGSMTAATGLVRAGWRARGRRGRSGGSAWLLAGRSGQRHQQALARWARVRTVALWVALPALLVVFVVFPEFRSGLRIWLWLYLLLVAWFVVARTKTASRSAVKTRTGEGRAFRSTGSACSPVGRARSWLAMPGTMCSRRWWRPRSGFPSRPGDAERASPPKRRG